MPADADALLVEIAELQVEERRQEAVLLDDADATAGAQAAADAATAWLRALNRRAAEAAAAVAAAAAEKERRDRWKTAAVAPPLDTLAGDAGDLRDGPEFTAAQDHVEEELPEAVRDAVDQGWAVENERLTQAAESEAHAWTLLQTEVTAGSPVALARTLAVADEALRRWAEQGTQRFARAAAQVGRSWKTRCWTRSLPRPSPTRWRPTSPTAPPPPSCAPSARWRARRCWWRRERWTTRPSPPAPPTPPTWTWPTPWSPSRPRSTAR